MVFAGGTSSVLASPFYLNMPMVSPAFPALRQAHGDVPRCSCRCTRLLWVGVHHRRSGCRARSCSFGTTRRIARDQLRERPERRLRHRAQDSSRRLGSAAAAGDPQRLGARRHARRRRRRGRRRARRISRVAIDSLARVLDPGAATASSLIVAIGYQRQALPELRKAPLNEAERLATLRRVIDAAASRHRPAGRRSVRRAASARSGRCPSRDGSRISPRPRASAKSRRQERSRRRGGVDISHGRQHALRVGRVAALADRRRRLLALSVAVRRRRHSGRHAHRRSLDARDAAEQGALGVRDRRLSARVRRAQPGRRRSGK